MDHSPSPDSPDSDFIADVRVDEDGQIEVDETDAILELDLDGERFREVRIGETGENERGPWESLGSDED